MQKIYKKIRKSPRENQTANEIPKSGGGAGTLS